MSMHHQKLKQWGQSLSRFQGCSVHPGRSQDNHPTQTRQVYTIQGWQHYEAFHRFNQSKDIRLHFDAFLKHEQWFGRADKTQCWHQDPEKKPKFLRFAAFWCWWWMQDYGASWWQVSTKSQFICQHVNYAHRSGREKMACRTTRIQRGMSFFPGDRYSTQSFWNPK